ncbi:MAG TPA: hypothetical protein PLQ03_06655 [Brevundimonas sp.]|uniref:hypothetical protein n=1 Tax=Brevundimonas sp. TaxID=1871086 RepID=UPI0026286BBC|nr:hypothetical protein [Brevundimonas sp.]HRO33077.1 hypothetical protein [Brevundimonas sp.]
MTLAIVAGNRARTVCGVDPKYLAFHGFPLLAGRLRRTRTMIYKTEQQSIADPRTRIDY